MANAPHRNAVAAAALQAALSGAWIAARELPPARRRLARLGLVAAVAAASRALPRPDSEAAGEPAAEREIVLTERPFLISEPPPVTDGLRPVPFDKRKAAVVAVVAGVSVAAIAGRRLLENRWLDRLAARGHPHPVRAVAVRMAAVEFTAQVALHLAMARRAGRRVPGAGLP